MTASLVGLLMLQFYWIKNVKQVHLDQLHEKVDVAMRLVVSDLEIMEQPTLLANQGKLKNYNISRCKKYHIGNLSYDEEAVAIEDTTIQIKDKLLDYLIISGIATDSSSGITAEHKLITKNYSSLFKMVDNDQMSSSKDSTLNYPMSLNNKYENGLLMKSKYLNEMMLKMFSTNVFNDIRLRLNPFLLDSLVKIHLWEQKIDTSFNFRVLDQKGEVIAFTKEPQNYKRQLEAPERAWLLYPSDFVSDPYYVEIEFPDKRKYLFQQMSSTLLAALLLVGIVLFAFYFSVNTIFKQKQLSNIKNDFINNMTHELKTPISTISLACEAIEDPDVSSNPQVMGSFVGMIQTENKRLATLVEKVLQSSLLEKGEMKLNKQMLKINRIVEDVVSSFKIQFEQKGGRLEILQLDEVEYMVDKIHFTNVFYNLMDNALKYSKETPVTKIQLNKTDSGFEFIIKDNGIGIKKEDQKRIFDKLYRVSTGDVHDVKGFGLGLDYVKRVVEAHNGSISVNSEINQGSTFILKFNYEQN